MKEIPDQRWHPVDFLADIERNQRVAAIAQTIWIECHFELLCKRLNSSIETVWIVDWFSVCDTDASHAQ